MLITKPCQIADSGLPCLIAGRHPALLHARRQRVLPPFSQHLVSMRQTCRLPPVSTCQSPAHLRIPTAGGLLCLEQRLIGIPAQGKLPGAPLRQLQTALMEQALAVLMGPSLSAHLRHLKAALLRQQCPKLMQLSV